MNVHTCNVYIHTTTLILWSNIFPSLKLCISNIFFQISRDLEEKKTYIFNQRKEEKSLGENLQETTIHKTFYSFAYQKCF